MNLKKKKVVNLVNEDRRVSGRESTRQTYDIKKQHDT